MDRCTQQAPGVPAIVRYWNEPENCVQHIPKERINVERLDADSVGNDEQV